MKTALTLTIGILFVTVAMAGEIPQHLIDSAISDSAKIVANNSEIPSEPSETNWELILGVFLSVYEILIRVVPTIKDYSLLSWAVKLISALIPNRKKEGGLHK